MKVSKQRCICKTEYSCSLRHRFKGTSVCFRDLLLCFVN